MRLCCGKGRGFTMHIVDNLGQVSIFQTFFIPLIIWILVFFVGIKENVI